VCHCCQRYCCRDLPLVGEFGDPRDQLFLQVTGVDGGLLEDGWASVIGSLKGMSSDAIVFMGGMGLLGRVGHSGINS